jgi:hypothetical protein
MICEKCGSDATVVGIVIHEETKQLWCRTCQSEWRGHANPAHCVIGDEIDIEIKHGLCHADGSPRRVRSREDLKRLAEKKGMTNYVQHERTPGPPIHKVTFGYGHTKGRVQR